MKQIAWRNRNKTLLVTIGCSAYSTVEQAQKQIDTWKQFFPQNSNKSLTSLENFETILIYENR